MHTYILLKSRPVALAVALGVGVAAVTAMPAWALEGATTATPASRAAPKIVLKPASSKAVTVPAAQALAEVEAALNALTTVRAEFTQTIPGQTTAVGQFYLQRPGRFLWRYGFPHRERILSTGTRLYYFEDEAGQVTELPRQHPMMALLGAATIDLKKAGFTLVEATRKADVLHVTMTLPDPDQGQNTKVVLALAGPLAGQPARLQSLTTYNQLGQPVRVEFSAWQAGVKLDKALFAFVPTVQKGAESGQVGGQAGGQVGARGDSR